MFRKLSIVSALFFVTACATQTGSSTNDSDQVASEEKRKDIVCTKTHRVGTNFKKTQCWTKDEYEDYKRRSREAVERAQGNSNMSGPEGR